MVKNRAFRLYCGLSNESGVIPESDFADWLKDSVGFVFEGFTVFRALGYWNGEPEQSAVIEVVSDDILAETYLRALGVGYCERFAQHCVLLSVADAKTESISVPVTDAREFAA